jgi:MoxR-like ATPase
LLWPVTARSTLREALYQYDAIARLQDAQLSQKPSPPTEPAPSEQSASEQGGDQQSKESSPKASITDYRNIGQYIRLGPVGTAFLPSKLPRLLLIDEIDKSDINLPNDLLNLFEEGSYKIPELVRLARQGNESQTVQSEDGVDVKINQGQVQCYEFPIVLMTSNGERDFPPAFYRRCLRVEMPDPDVTELKEIVKAHLGEEIVQEFEKVILNFDDKNQSTESGLATDQLLNTVYLLKQKADEETITRLLFQSLSPTEKGS